MDGLSPYGPRDRRPCRIKSNVASGRVRDLMNKSPAKIEDYAFLSDTQTGALVSRDGCIDWLCFPRFDSAACFASLLGEAKKGYWLFYPNEEITQTQRRYRGEALIIETEIETDCGTRRRINFK